MGHSRSRSRSPPRRRKTSPCRSRSRSRSPSSRRSSPSRSSSRARSRSPMAVPDFDTAWRVEVRILKKRLSSLERTVRSRRRRRSTSHELRGRRSPSPPTASASSSSSSAAQVIPPPPPPPAATMPLIKQERHVPPPTFERVMHGSHITLSATPHAHDATFATARAAAYAPRPMSASGPPRGGHNGNHGHGLGSARSSSASSSGYATPRPSAFDAARAANLGTHAARPSPTVTFLDGEAILNGNLLYPPNSREAEFALPYPVPQAVRHMTMNWVMRKGDRWLNRSARLRYWKAHEDAQGMRSGAYNAM